PKNQLTGRVCTCLTITLAMLAGHVGRAATVTNPDDSGPGTLRDVLANSRDGDVITFAVTNINLHGQLTIDHNVTIAGPGPDNFVVECGGDDGGFYIAPGIVVTISGLTIADSPLMAIQINSATLTISNCSVSNCGGDYNMGGIENGGTLTVLDSTFA